LTEELGLAAETRNHGGEGMETLNEEIEGFLLSPQQRRLWYLGTAGAGPLRMLCRVSIRGSLDQDLLKSSLSALVERHEILRTRYQFVPGFTDPLQVIGDSSHFSWEVEELSGLEREDQLSELQAHWMREWEHPLVVAESPPLRAKLLKYERTRHDLLINLPALAADATTARLLVSELGEILRQGGAIAAQEDSSLQYLQISEWLNEMLEVEDSEVARAHWRRLDLEALASDVLPFQLPGRLTGDLDTLHGALDSAMTSSLDSYAEGKGTVVPVVLLAAWRSLLQLQGASGSLGLVGDGRKFEEMIDLPGSFARLLPLEIPRGLSTFDSAVEELIEEVAQAEEFQEGLELPRPGEGKDPIVLPFGFESWDVGEAMAAGSVNLAIEDLASAADRFRILLSAIHQNGVWRLQLTHDSESLTSSAASRLMDTYLNFITEAVAAPEVSLEGLDLLGQAGRDELLSLGRGPLQDRSNVLVHELFEEVARQSPDASAVRWNDEDLTFAELNERATSLANHLKGLGVGPDSVVALMFEHTPAMVVAVLGVLKAEAAYLPLDPGTPDQRRAFMLDDADACIVLSHEPLRKFLETEASEDREAGAPVPPVLWLDSGGVPMAKEVPSSGLFSSLERSHPESLAYVIYTSGSTGKPKGTMIPHRGVVNYLLWARDNYAMTEGDGAPLHSSIAFDISVTSLLLPLISGKAIELLPSTTHVEALATALQRRGGFSLVKLTPSHLRILSQQLDEEDLRNRTQNVILGGEPLAPEDVVPWQTADPSISFFNEYGPTETVVGCTIYRCGSSAFEAESVPIGRPVGNTLVAVVDHSIHLLPMGLEGELVAGGAGVSRGYLGQPRLTAELFVPDPFFGAAGARLYRTGDRARWQPDGELQFLGRADDQVKIRGHRVELGEIEAVLRRREDLEEVVVVARRDELGGDRLLAYLLPVVEESSAARRPAPTVTELRSFLEASLPEYMVPAAFVAVDEMPHTSSGKVDRRSLPEPEALLAASGAFYTPPRTVEEEILAGIWSQVLGAEQVGIDDDFFALGGDSIRSIQVVSLAQEKGLDLVLDQIFEQRSVRKLATELVARQIEAATPKGVEPFSLISEEDRQLVPEGVEDAVPLSQLQGGMIFHNEASPGEGIYHDVFSFFVRSKTPIDVDVLRTAVDRLVQRHPALRTSFDVTSFSQPLQVVWKKGASPLGVEDLRHLSEEEQNVELASWREEEVRTGFQIDRLPLIRYQLHLRGEKSFQFAVSFHHAIIDGWSDASMVTELAVSYQSLVRGEGIPFEAPQTRHSDFVALELEALASEETRAFWWERLANLPPVAIPRLQPAAENGLRRETSWQAVEIPEELSDALKGVARTAAVPIKNVLLAVHLRVLAFLRGSADTWTCVTANGRPETADGERVLGLFLNSLPLRLKLQGGSWLDLIQRVFDAEREALVHRRFPMPEMQRWVDGSRLRETSFYFTHYHVYHALERFTDFEAPLSIDFHEVTSFPIVTSFRVDPFTSHVRMNLTCDGNLFSDEQTKRFAQYYLRALRALAEDPESRYDALGILDRSEMSQVIESFNRAPEVSHPRLFLDRFAEVASSSSEAPALVCGEETWSFAELDRRSGLVARGLQQHGVKEEMIVGVLLERSPDFVAVLLGIFKAGASYLPLDPQYPEKRISFLLEDSGATILVYSENSLPSAMDIPEGVLGLQASSLIGRDEPIAQAVEVPRSPEALAYVIYTSGSTGEPKGVGVSQGALAGYLSWAADAYGGSGSGSLVHSSISFDLTVTSLFVPLLSGQPAILVPNSSGLDGLAEAIRANPGTSFLKLTPSHARLLSKQLGGEEVAVATQALILGGEALQGEDLATWREVAPATVVHNEYGPTEAVVGCTLGPRPVSDLKGGAISLGRPAPGCRVYLVDDFLQAVPLGTTGQVNIGGRSLARGYLKRPGLTAERFLPDPFSSIPGSRMYCTGDLAAFDEEGVLEFHGRFDDQVKVRGFRIELGEVEAVLAQHPAVGQAVAVVGGSEEVGGRLVAFIVPKDVEVPPSEDLRRFLSERLPDFMVPAVFVILDDVPLTPNGKVDRAALPDPGETHARLAAPYAPPMTRDEEILTSIWCRVLDVDRVGIDDDYFALGGDSIRSVPVVALARKKGVHFAIDDLFEHRTIRALVQSLKPLAEESHFTKQASFDGVSKEDQQGMPAGAVDAYPMSQLQAGMIYHREREEKSAFYHNMGSFHLKAPLDLDLLRESLDGLVARHETLRTTFHLSAFREPLQVVHSKGATPLEIGEDLSGLDSEEQATVVEQWLVEERERGFNHEELPLLRFTIHPRGNGTFQFSQSFHHSILDGWSNASLLAELFTDYFARLGGDDLELSAPDTRVRDFVVLERQAMEDPAAREHWSRVVTDAPFLELPRGRRGEVAASDRVGIREIAISEAVAAGLSKLVRATAVPMRSVLLGAHLRALALLAGREEGMTLVTSTGRPETHDGERTLGLFLNSTPVRLRLGGGTWQELSGQVFETERQGIAFRRFPLAEMQKLRGGTALSETAFYFTHFHVYQSLESFESLEVLDYSLREETNYGLLASFGMEPFSGRLHCHVACDRNLLSDEQIESIATYYERVLAAMASAPSGRYDSSCFLASEEAQILASTEPGEVRRDRVPSATVVELFLESVTRQGQALALESRAGENWSYDELADRSSQIALSLRNRGIGAESIVGLYLKRSPAAVAAILGVLRAGGAYLPLDPAYPRRRLELMLEDARAEFVITEPALVSTTPAGAAPLLIQDLLVPTEGTSDSSLPFPMGEQMAYVLFTSGSTGRPKGVMVPHAALASYLLWAVPTYSRGGGSRLHSSLSFDLTVTGLFVPLLAGEKVVLVDEEAGVEALGIALQAQKDLSFVKITPSHLRLLSQQLDGGDLEGRTHALILGGEALSSEDLSAWREEAPATVIHNEYGPTETVVGCTLYSTSVASLEEGPVPVGLPVAGSHVALLDGFFHPVPQGVAGEVVVGGPGVTRGYLGHPGRTAASFVPDPFSEHPGARMYCTGDLARRRLKEVESPLEFLGRRDQQVKIRGHRVELGEIRRTLEEHPRIGAAEVLATSDRLVAYLVPESGGSPPPEELREHLLDRLPEPFQPAAFVPLPEIPLTPNGKVDRAALEALDPLNLGLEGDHTAPRTPTEEILCGVWEQCLEVDSVGIDDDYFVLGGDSIRSLQVVSLARDQGIELNLDSLFKYRTVRHLAEAVKEARVEGAHQSTTEAFSLITDEDQSLLPEGIEDAYPLTRLQAGMLYHREARPDSAVYHDLIRFRLKAPFEEEPFREAAAQVALRHPALRTTFHLAGFSEPLQLVHEVGGPEVVVYDLRGQPESEQEAALEGWVASEKARGFDPERPPLIRYHIHRLTDEVFQFGLSFHHAIIDGWSDASMLTEVAVSYFSIRQGLPSPFTPPESRYRDFVALEQEALNSEKSRAYWLDLLEGSSFLEVPSWKQDGEPVPEGVEALVYNIDEATFHGLQRLARSTAVPIKSVLLAVHLKVMAMVSGQTDVLTTLASSGRLETADGERVMGLFLNSLPFRLHLGGGTWKDLVKATFRAEEEALPHRRFPMAEIQRLRGGNALAETGFYFTHYHIFRNLQRFADLEVVGYDAYEETNFGFGVNFGVNRDSTGLRMVVSGLSEHYPNRQLEHLGGQYKRVLEAMAQDGLAYYERFAALTPAEVHQVLEEWNDTGLRLPVPETIHSFFEAQVEQTPELEAVRFEGGSLSYQVLGANTETLANALRAKGAQRGSRIGVFLERSLELITAFLAVLRSGGTYVPLDPAYPRERLAFMMEDAKLEMVVTITRLLPELPPSDGTLFCLDEDWSDLEKSGASLPPVNGSPEDLAYIIFTSGSTGRPKGVMVPHRAFAAIRAFQIAKLGAGHGTRIAQLASLSFDAAVFDSVMALTHGGALCLPSGNLPVIGDQLGDFLLSEKITFAGGAPSLVATLPDHEYPDLAFLEVVGEECSPDLVERWAPGRRFINGYGPTENTICATDGLCRAGTGRASIGGPSASTRVYLGDAFLELVPVGTSGEILLGGGGVCWGYLERPALTAERFVPDPFTSALGGRMYRTGDLARHRKNGELDFLGRIDNQVQLRGFRIELGEIETALMGLEGVSQAVVMLREDEPGDQRLVAYLVARSDEELDPTALEHGLAQSVPRFMLPSAYLVLDSVPVTPNGKIDRKALPAPGEGDLNRRAPYVAPRTKLEERLAALWVEVLSVDRVGVDDDFFQLGGHSILATRLISRVRETFNVSLALGRLFDSPTVASLALVVEEFENSGGENLESAILPTTVEPELASSEDLPDEELDALLESMMSEEDPVDG